MIACATGFSQPQIDDNYPFGCQPLQTKLGFDSIPQRFSTMIDACSDVVPMPTSWFRIGEASNPGPLNVGCFNPAQMFGHHEDVVCAWGPGIYGAAETSHTVTAMLICTSRFRKEGFNVVWGPPVPLHRQDMGSIRGRAAGVAVISHLQVARFPIPPPAEIVKTCRLVESIVHLRDGLRMYVASIYGPASGRTHYDPWAILAGVCEAAFHNASNFKGPAIIMGGFNVDRSQVPFWNKLQAAGWSDAADFDAQRRGTNPRPTSRGLARKSFIFINQQLLPHLLECDTEDDFSFDAHPLLLAKFDLDSVCKPIRVWKLPQSTDQLFLDSETFESEVAVAMDDRQSKFDRAMQRCDSEDALRQINLVFEQAAANACVDTEGAPSRFPLACIGRCRKPITKIIPPAAVVVKKGRADHYTPAICQPSLHIRRRTKQIRRLQSLKSQLQAASNAAHDFSPQCWFLWNSILNATGFSQGFQRFALTTLGIFVPTECPPIPFVAYLANALRCHVETEIQEEKTKTNEKRQARVAQDVKEGGSRAYASVRDPMTLPFQAIESLMTFQLKRVKWTKDGRDCLFLLNASDQLDLDLPLSFQGQLCYGRSQEGSCVKLDRKVVLKNVHDLTLQQTQVICDQHSLQQSTCAAWSQMWRREPDDDLLDNWPDLSDKLTCLGDCPSMDFESLTVDEWKANVKAVKKSARGCDAYTPREFLLMPRNLVQWLLDLLGKIEAAEMVWPSSLMKARVIMLGKTEQAPTSPLQIRPITIASRIYRTWSRYRALQICRHLQSILPREIAGTAAGVGSAQLIATLACEIEAAHYLDCPKLGATVDLVKCFNQIPRQPILIAMLKLGIPQPYLNALDSMFTQLARILEIAQQVGDQCLSTTGVPEGCCFSTVCMLRLTAWMAKLLETTAPDSTCVAYADNWEILSPTFEALKVAISELWALVSALE